MSKLNIKHIIVNHFNTLRNINTGKKSLVDIFVFFIFPVVVGVVLTLNSISLNSIVGDLLKAIAIFSAFLFNMLAIVNNSIDSDKVKNDKIRSLYAREIHTNLSFEILIGIILVFFLIFQSILYSLSIKISIIHYAVETINISLLGTFLLTLIMCLNRVYILIKY